MDFVSQRGGGGGGGHRKPKAWSERGKSWAGGRYERGYGVQIFLKIYMSLRLHFKSEEGRGGLKLEKNNAWETTKSIPKKKLGIYIGPLVFGTFTFTQTNNN